MTYLDTSVIIDFLAGDPEIVSIITEVVARDTIKTTTISEYELLKHKTEIKKQIAEKFLSSIFVTSFDRSSARKAALLYEKISAKGKLVNENDLLIAGIALANDDVLLTRDQKFVYFEDKSIKIV